MKDHLICLVQTQLGGAPLPPEEIAVYNCDNKWPPCDHQRSEVRRFTCDRPQRVQGYNVLFERPCNQILKIFAFLFRDRDLDQTGEMWY